MTPRVYGEGVLDGLLDVLFPPKCVGCERRGVVLCEPCRRELPYLPPGLCGRCASHRSARGMCRGCRRLSPSISAVHAVFAYDGAARSAVLTLKFRSGRYLAPLMGELICEALTTRPLQADAVVPVPLAPWKLRKRGFNQAYLLAEAVACRMGGAVTEALTRQERPAQSTLAAAERLENVNGAFTCREETQVRDKRVVLVDDVVTTGATVSACADTLVRAGARRINVLAFARDL